ncbi:uncharacterized protein L199_006691 [Kwoniella botswanensis]|uniref:uncharacterized protein n=1 Tax=Kwoniella botswanensis TaxID=1268659 RepID=UPI00315DEDC1
MAEELDIAILVVGIDLNGPKTYQILYTPDRGPFQSDTPLAVLGYHASTDDDAKGDAEAGGGHYVYFEEDEFRDPDRYLCIYPDDFAPYIDPTAISTTQAHHRPPSEPLGYTFLNSRPSNEITSFPPPHPDVDTHSPPFALTPTMKVQDNLYPIWNCRASGCDERCHTIWELRAHHDTHEDKHPKIFQCPICSRWYDAEAAIQQHCREKHEMVKCIQCPAPLNNGHPCSALYSDCSKIKTHVVNHPQHSRCREIPFQCSICMAICNTKENMERHIKVKHGERMPCSEGCGKTFADVYKMRAHVKNLHQDENEIDLEGLPIDLHRLVPRALSRDREVAGEAVEEFDNIFSHLHEYPTMIEYFSDEENDL